MKAYCITSVTHVRKIRVIADVTAEILNIKNGSVGNLFKHIISVRNESKYGSVAIGTALKNLNLETLVSARYSTLHLL